MKEPIPTDKCLARLLLIGEPPPIGSYILHRNILGTDVMHCYIGLARKEGDVQIIQIGIYPTKAQPKGFMLDYDTAGNYYVPENQNPELK